MGCIKKKHSHQPKIPSINSFRALSAHQIKHIRSHLFLQGALCCGTMPSNYLAEMRAFISLNTFMTHPTQTPFLKMETLSISVKAPPAPQTRSGACCTAEGTSGHGKEHFRWRRACLLRGQKGNLGAPRRLGMFAATASLAGGLLQGLQLLCWRKRAALGEGLRMAMLHPRWGSACVNQLGRWARRSRERQPCARPTAGQRSVGCNPNHRRWRVIPVPVPTGDSGRIADALRPLPASSARGLGTESKGKPSGEKVLFCDTESTPMVNWINFLLTLMPGPRRRRGMLSLLPVHS